MLWIDHFHLFYQHWTLKKKKKKLKNHWKLSKRTFSKKLKAKEQKKKEKKLRILPIAGDLWRLANRVGNKETIIWRRKVGGGGERERESVCVCVRKTKKMKFLTLP